MLSRRHFTFFDLRVMVGQAWSTHAEHPTVELLQDHLRSHLLVLQAARYKELHAGNSRGPH